MFPAFVQLFLQAKLLQAAAKDPVGSLMMVAGTVISILGAPQIGVPLAVSGLMRIVSGMIFAVKPTEEPHRDSPTYGIQQFENRSKGDAAVPIVYSNDTASTVPGHRMAPIYVAAAATPKGFEDSDFARTKGTRGQGLSCLFAVAEGPIVGIEDVRINDEPLWETLKDLEPANGANGSRKDFDFTVKNLDLDTLSITTNGTSKGWTRTTVTEVLRTAPGIGHPVPETQTVFIFQLPAYNAGQQRIDDSDEVRFYLGSAATTSTLLPADDTAELRPVVWQEGGPGRLVIWTQQPVPAGKTLYIRVPIKRLDNCSVSYTGSKNKLTVKFATAPAAGTKIRVACRRKLLNGVRCEYRYGAAHQLPIDGFDSVRNAASVNVELTKSDPATERTTDEEVDDVVIDLSALGGLYVRDNEDGSLGPRSVEFEINWKPYGASAWYKLRDTSDAANSKSLYHFKVSGMSTAALFWAFSVKRLLEQWCEDHPGDSAASRELAAWNVRKRIVVSVHRITAAPSDPLVVDDLTWTTYEKVIHEKLSMPGVALLSFHGLASSKLQGALPTVTCRVVGKADVEAYSGGAWVASETAQANPVWAAVDLITARRYGGGEQFTKADNIDAAAAYAAAAWCDTAISDGNGGSEKQCVLDIVLDTRGDLMEQVARLLIPHRVVPVLRGNVWTFVIDQAVTLADVVTLYDDGSDGVMFKDSLTFAHQPQTSEVTEVQLSYLDRADDWEKNEIWIATTDPTTDRRIERVVADGVTRATQATRYGKWIHAKAKLQGVNIGWSMVPVGLRHEAGDVVKVVSTRLGITLYARIMRWSIDSTESMVVVVEAAQYVPAVYGQSAAAQVVAQPRKPRAVNIMAPTTTGAATSDTTATSKRAAIVASGRKLSVSIRRAA